MGFPAPSSHTVVLQVSLHSCSSLESHGKLPYFPSTGKKDIIIPIQKPKELGTYHPISLLSCLGKIVERMVLNWLQWSTWQVHSIATLLSTLCATPSAVVFLDLEKAFVLASTLAKWNATGRGPQSCPFQHPHVMHPQHTLGSRM